MSSYLDNFIKETENDLNYVPPSLDTEEVTQPVTPVVQQEVVESVMQLNDEISTGKLIEGTAVSVTAEIGTGVGLTYALNRYRPAMKWLKGVSHASKLGIVAPEPSTTVAGIAGLAASEALIWAGSNLLGQSIRKAYGIQEEYSAGEALAAGVFGTTLVATKADKLIFGLARPAVDDVWKGREMLMTTAKGFKRKKFISGAALGLAESAMRQEIEVLMNDDKNRNEYDYLFSALAGGGANTLFGMWSRTGKWGREQAESVIRSSKENLKAQKIKAENQLKASQEPLPDAVTYSFGGRYAQYAKSSAEFNALKQLKHIEEAEEVMDDALNNVIAANKKLGEREANPQPLKDVVEEAEVTAPKAPEVDEDIPLGLKRSPFIDPNLTNVDDDAFDSIEVKTRKELEKLEDDYFNKGGFEQNNVELKRKLAAAQDAYSAVELEKFRRQIEGEEPWFIASEFRTLANATQNSESVFKLALLGETVNKRGIQKEVFAELESKIGKDENAKEVFEGQLKKAKEAMEAFKKPPVKQIEAEVPKAPEPTVEQLEVTAPKAEEPDAPKQLWEMSKEEFENPYVTASSDDTIVLYHRTSQENAERIKKDGLRKGEDDVVWLTEKPDTNYTEGALIEIEVKKSDVSDFNARGRQGWKVFDKDIPIENIKAVHDSADDDIVKFAGSYDALRSNPRVSEKARKAVVKAALERGEVVPENVLKDFPDLQKTTTPKAPEQTPDESKLSELSERVKNINSDNLTTEAPNIERDAKRLSERTTGKLRTAIATSIKDPDNVDNLQDALDAVVFQRKINKQVIDILETSGGRTLSAARRDSDKFNYEAKYSFRAAKEEASLSELEASLRQRLEGAESDDIKKLFDDFINIRPNLKAQGKAINKKASKKGKGKAKPKAPLTDAQQAEKLKQTLAKKKANLQKELDTKRERFGDDVKLEEAQAKASKDRKPEDPEVKDLKERIKFYDDAEADVALIEKLEKQLARVVEIEASSIVGAQRAETSAKPKPPTKAPGKADELRQKITDTRARMRQRVADIDRAQAQINKERELSEIYRTYEKHFFESLEKDASTIFSKTLRSIQQARQLALIDQIPSVFAGLPTGVGAGIKQFVRIVGTLLDEGLMNRSGNAIKYATADAFGAMKMLTDTAGLMEAMKRTFREGASATTQTGSKFSDEVSQSSLPRGEHALISRAYDSAKRRADALDNVTNKFSGWVTTNNFWHILSLGVRGIQAVDEVFKRQVIKGRIWSQAAKNGVKAFPNDKAKAAKYAEQNYNAAWKDNDGLAVLDETNEFYDEINQVNEELLFASNVDNVEDMYVPASEKIVKGLTELANDTDSILLGNTLKLIMPFIGVPIRGAYRMANYSLFPAAFIKSKVANPYTAKMKAILSEVKKAEEVLHTNISDDFKKSTEAEVATLQKRYETLKVRRLKYNAETMTDALVGFSLIAGGSALTLSGNNNGSLAWMTREQRENNKLQPFTMFGSDYKSAMPWAGPLAFGGDVAAWYAMKHAETTTGAPLLTKEQTLPMVLRTSFVTLLKEQPLTSGIKAVEEVTTGEGDVYRNAIAQIIGSYVPIPAEARKITQMLVNEEGTVADLRGGTFYERIAYAALGVEPDNKKTDRFGEHTQTPRTWLTQTVTRLAPRAEKERTEIDKIIATDVHGNIASKPTMLMSGVRMTEFRNEEGLTLDYVFNRRLKDTYIGKYTLKERITERINSDSWKAKFEKGFQPSETNPDTLVNEGLKQLNSDFQKYYKRTRERILKDKNLLNSFVNSDEENLLQIIENLTLDTEGSGTPLSPLEVLGIE